jgi:hypothetical protein
MPKIRFIRTGTITEEFGLEDFDLSQEEWDNLSEQEKEELLLKWQEEQEDEPPRWHNAIISTSISATDLKKDELKMLHKNTHTFSIHTGIGMCGGFTLQMEPVAVYELVDEETGEFLNQFGYGYDGEEGEMIGWATMVSIPGSGINKFFFKNKKADPSRALPLMEKLIPYAIAGDEPTAKEELQAVKGDRLKVMDLKDYDCVTTKVGNERVPIFNEFLGLPVCGITLKEMEVPGPQSNSGCPQVIHINQFAKVKIVTQQDSYGMGLFGADCIQGVYVQKGEWNYNFIL